MATERWPVIDTHFHIGVNSFVTFLAEEELIPLMDANGIDIQVVFQVNEGFTHRTPEWNQWLGNDYIARIQKQFPDRVIGLGLINPWFQPPKVYAFSHPRAGEKCDLVSSNPTIDEVERCIVELGLHGLKIHPLYLNYSINDPGLMDPIFEKLVELQEQVGRKLFLVIHAGGESLHNSPTAIMDAAQRFPDLLFIAAHSGFIWGGGTVASTMAKCSNVFLDLCTMPQKSIVMGAYEMYGPGKFTAGTDGPFCTYEITRAIVHDMFKASEERELVMGGNLARYLGLPKKQA